MLNPLISVGGTAPTARGAFSFDERLQAWFIDRNLTQFEAFYLAGIDIDAYDLVPYFRQHCRLHKPYVANTKYCYFHAGKLLRCIEKNSCQSLSKQKTGQMLYRGPYAYSPATPLMILTLPQDRKSVVYGM